MSQNLNEGLPKTVAKATTQIIVKGKVSVISDRLINRAASLTITGLNSQKLK